MIRRVSFGIHLQGIAGHCFRRILLEDDASTSMVCCRNLFAAGETSVIRQRRGDRFRLKYSTLKTKGQSFTIAATSKYRKTTVTKTIKIIVG